MEIISVGDIVGKTSGKPFKNGSKIATVEKMVDFNPQDPKKRPAIQVAGVVVNLEICYKIQ